MEFIPAKDLPATEAEEVDVLCVENGKMKRKAVANLGGAGFTNVYIGDWVECFGGSTYSGYVCYKDPELTEKMTYAEFKEIAEKVAVRLPYTYTEDDGSTWNAFYVLHHYEFTDDYKTVYEWGWDCYLFFADTELPAAVSTLSLDEETEVPASITHIPYPPRN